MTGAASGRTIVEVPPVLRVTAWLYRNSIPIVLALTVALGVSLVVSARNDAWRERRFDRTLLAHCIVDDEVHTQQVAGRYFSWVYVVPVVRPKRTWTPMWTPVPASSTADEALAAGRTWREGASSANCYYDMKDEGFVTMRPRADYLPAAEDGATGVLMAIGAIVGLVLVRRSRERRRRIERGGKPSWGRRARLAEAKEHLPVPLPEGWTQPTCPQGLVCWTLFAGDLVLWTWTSSRAMRELNVALARKDGRGRVSDAEAAVILEQFTGLTEFIEYDRPPRRIAQEHPKVRAWIAAPKHFADERPRPAKLPVPKEEPLNPILVAARKHLPAKLPVGWSVPLAVTDVYEGWSNGAWMIEDDDAVLLTCIVASLGRVKLAVAIFHPDQHAVTEARAMDALKHFRGVSEFVQTDHEGSLPGGRLYLGEIQRKDERAMLN